MPYQSAAPSPYGQAPAPGAGQPPVPGAGQPFAGPSPYGTSNSPSLEGCVSAAWHDVKATQGWFGKLLLLGLINIVPILNFVVQGYALQWARELS